MSDIFIGTHFEVKEKIVTISAIERSIWKALKNFDGTKVLLTMSKKINDLCKINIDYDEDGFGVFKINMDDRLSEKEFILTELGGSMIIRKAREETIIVMNPNLTAEDILEELR